MEFIALFFICVKMYAFMNAQELAYFLHSFANILRHRRENPGSKQIIFMDKAGMRFISYLALDILFLLYCLYLLSDDNTWKPGFLLLAISAMEAYALRARIYGTYVRHKLGYVYSSLWFRHLMTGMSLFILLKLFKTT
ncbi:MAG: hypothetical protein IJX10_04745 [Phascolarctobacterium sp.]|nr:hypothetical protein [Phascolarctobacterium sp.]